MYKHPGVYIEHVPSGLLAIEAASTSVAAFIGPAKRGPVGEPVFISNVGQFEEQFGVLGGGAGGIRNEGGSADRFGYAVNAFFANGGTKAYILRVAESPKLSKAKTVIPNPEDPARGFTITAASEGAWGNALQVRLTATDSGTQPDLTLGYKLQIGIEQDGKFAALETFTGLSMDKASGQFIENVVEDSSVLVDIHGDNADEDDFTADGLLGTPVVLDVDTGKALLGGKVLKLKVGDDTVEVRFDNDTADLTALAAHIQATVRASIAASPDFIARFEVEGRLRLVSGLLGAPGKVITPVTNAVANAAKAAVEKAAKAAEASDKAADKSAKAADKAAKAASESQTADKAAAAAEAAVPQGAPANDPLSVAAKEAKEAAETARTTADKAADDAKTAADDAKTAAEDAAIDAAAVPALGILGLAEKDPEKFPPRNLTAGGVIEAWLNGGDDGRAAPSVSKYEEAYKTLRDWRDVSILLLPALNWIENGDNSIVENAVTHCELMKNRMVIVDPPDTSTIANEIKTPKGVKDLGAPTSPYAALYYPWLDVSNPHYDPDTAANLPRTFSVPPSAFAAGMWSRIDGRRGVWKAPAGLEATVRGTLGPNVLIGNDVQDNLNEWGVNCLRAIVGPTVIWGARTLATKSKPEFRYVPVRRTQNMIGESLYNALQAVVFEPNDHRLWGSLRASVGSFMDGLHRAGAFQGEKASDAYRVSCGLDSTMTKGDVEAGVVRVVVEFAPLKPAEFVVVQIKQIVGRTA